MANAQNILFYNNDLLTRAQAGRYLGGISPKTLAVWQCTGRYALPIVKVGRLVRYRRADLDAFLEERRIGGKR